MILITMLTLNACMGVGVCSEKQIGEATSPDGRFIAVLFLRNCGATTPFMQHVNLREKKHSRGEFSPDSRGAIEDGQVFLTSAGALSIAWEDAKTLVVKCKNCPHNCCDKAWVKSWNDIKVSYQPPITEK